MTVKADNTKKNTAETTAKKTASKANTKTAKSKVAASKTGSTAKAKTKVSTAKKTTKKAPATKTTTKPTSKATGAKKTTTAEKSKTAASKAAPKTKTTANKHRTTKSTRSKKDETKVAASPTTDTNITPATTTVSKTIEEVKAEATNQAKKRAEEIAKKSKTNRVPVRSKAARAAARGEKEDKTPRKIAANDRKLASKGQTKEEQQAKNDAFNQQRATWFDRYMKGTLPGLYDLHISTDRNVLLDDDQQLQLAAFIQAGIAGKVLLRAVEKKLGHENPTHVQRTVKKHSQDILDYLAAEGYTVDKYADNRRERRKLERLVNQAENARFIFAEKNLGLVTMIAGRRKKKDASAAAVEFDELVAEGMNGLMSAIDHYNPATGFKFSTPAAWWIEQPIRNYLDSKTKTIHMPTHMNNIYKSIEYAKNALREQYPDDASITDELIAEYCQSTGRDITVEKIQEAYQFRRETVSYDAPMGTESKSNNEKSLVEMLDTGEDVSYSVLDKIGGRDNFNRMLALVDDDKKREVLRDWYSSEDMHEIVILSNVSRKHCLTKERVRQLKQEGEAELHQKISELSREKGVGLSEAVMLEEEDMEEETFRIML